MKHEALTNEKLFDDLVKNITVIGGGLIGGSLLLELKQNKPKVILNLLDNNPQHLEQARQRNMANLYFNDINQQKTIQAIKQSDVVVVALPMEQINHVIMKLDAVIKANAVLTDVGSVKQSVMPEKIIEKQTSINKIGGNQSNSSRKLSRMTSGEYNFIPGHPIAGTEFSGPAASFVGLFKNNYAIITPYYPTQVPASAQQSSASNVEKAKAIISQMWQSMGAKIVEMDAQYHDHILALTSHLPTLLAFSLVSSTIKIEDELQEDIIKYSASGFRDFTRLAASDPIMWHDICISNKKEISKLIEYFQSHLSVLKDNINNENSQQLLDLFSSTSDVRRQIVEKKLDVNVANFGRNRSSKSQ